MKDIFFKGLLVALPVLGLGGLCYLIFHGFYSLYQDIQLKKELDEIRRESIARRQQPAPLPEEPKTSPEDLFT